MRAMQQARAEQWAAELGRAELAGRAGKGEGRGSAAGPPSRPSQEGEKEEDRASS